MTESRRRVLVLAAQAFLLGLSVVFLIVPASALFLERYGAQKLPFVYLSVAVLGVVVSRVMGSLQARLSLVGVARWCIGVFVVITAGGWLLLHVGGHPWVSAVLVTLFPLSIPVGFVMVGTQAGRLLDVRSLKQYFARIVAGFSLGFVVGGLATAILTGPLGGPGNLLLIDVGSGVVWFATVVASGRWFPDELGRRPEPQPRDLVVAAAETSSTPDRGLFLVLFGYQLLAAAITQLLDYIVWERAAFHFPDPNDLTRFQGLYDTLMNVVALGFVFLVAGRLLVRYGERGGLAANPLGLGVLLVFGTAVGALGGPDGTTFFVVMCAQQIAHIALTDGMTRAAINTAYQALEPRSRIRAQTVVEAAGVPLALGFVGILLLVFHATHLGVRAVAVITLVLTVAWLVTALVAHTHYRSGVLALVTARPWEPLDLVESDGRVVSSLLAGSRMPEVRAALSAVGPVGPRSGAAMAGLLVSPDPYARLAAAAALAGGGGATARRAEQVWTEAVAGPDAELRDAALAGCAAVRHPFFLPYLLDVTASAPASASLTDVLDRYAVELAPLAVDRLAVETSALARERLVAALGRMRDSLPDTPAGLPDLRAEVELRADRAARARDALGVLEGHPGSVSLRRALVEDTEHSAQILADHLAMRQGQRGAERIVAALGGAGADQRAMAVELLEVLVGRELGERMAGLLAPWVSADDLATALAGRGEPGRSADAWLRDLVEDPEARWDDPWLRACALHAAPAVVGSPAALRLAEPRLGDRDEVVAETAGSVVAQLGGS
jgi:hypothetical protein